jgi:hypothetical protein
MGAPSGMSLLWNPDSKGPQGGGGFFAPPPPPPPTTVAPSKTSTQTQTDEETARNSARLSSSSIAAVTQLTSPLGDADYTGVRKVQLGA